MSLEEKLASWTGPSSNGEQENQERTERMIREAVNSHDPFAGCSLKVYAKGSYANNTNVRADSDVDIAVNALMCNIGQKRRTARILLGLGHILIRVVVQISAVFF